MIILRYDDTTYSPEEIIEYSNGLKEITEEEVIALPQEWDILFNCSTAELYDFIDHIKEIIKQKEIANGEY